MKTATYLFLTALVALLLFVVSGCGPGQPFEIESTRAAGNQPSTCVASANSW